MSSSLCALIGGHCTHNCTLPLHSNVGYTHNSRLTDSFLPKKETTFSIDQIILLSLRTISMVWWLLCFCLINVLSIAFPYWCIFLLLLQVSLVLLFMVGVIVYKLLVIHPLYKNPDFQPHANQLVSATGAILNLIVIMILSRVSQEEKFFYPLSFAEFFSFVFCCLSCPLLCSP